MKILNKIERLKYLKRELYASLLAALLMLYLQTLTIEQLNRRTVSAQFMIRNF